eukprot:CAMPEP_0182427690 /NCGR_PEP_ID=MMETSP1167-20130531/18987_1 /TAXON_ID=2988 /ORGANISM="Mallomonas Sp, Strain CCMP3275" /LENGTH=89 /DNA_ID=CAMNT_0024610113 /DNA_START=510 /DNA_END=775 /DNA_ORIENTATION=+
MLVTCDKNVPGDPVWSGVIGRALVPYYRQLLPKLSIFAQSDDEIEVEDDTLSNKKIMINIGQYVMETLEILEMEGGQDAFVNIKYFVAT